MGNKGLHGVKHLLDIRLARVLYLFKLIIRVAIAQADRLRVIRS